MTEPEPLPWARELEAFHSALSLCDHITSALLDFQYSLRLLRRQRAPIQGNVHFCDSRCMVQICDEPDMWICVATHNVHFCGAACEEAEDDDEGRYVCAVTGAAVDMVVAISRTESMEPHFSDDLHVKQSSRGGGGESEVEAGADAEGEGGGEPQSTVQQPKRRRGKARASTTSRKNRAVSSLPVSSLSRFKISVNADLETDILAGFNIAWTKLFGNDASRRASYYANFALSIWYIMADIVSGTKDMEHVKRWCLSMWPRPVFDHMLAVAAKMPTQKNLQPYGIKTSQFTAVNRQVHALILRQSPREQQELDPDEQRLRALLGKFS